MLIEPFVLDRHESVGEIIRDHVPGYRDPVGVRRDQLGHLILFRIVYKGRETFGTDIDDCLVGRAVDHAPKNADSQADAYRAETDDPHQKNVGNAQNDLFHSFPALRGKIVLPAAYSSSAKIHITDLFLSESDLSLDYSKTAKQNKGLHKNVILF